MHAVIEPRTFTNYAFQISLWATILFAIGMIIAGSIDLSLGLKWGFSSKDVLMAVVVLAGAIVVKMIGSKIIAAFGGGL